MRCLKGVASRGPCYMCLNVAFEWSNALFAAPVSRGPCEGLLGRFVVFFWVTTIKEK